MVKIIRLALLTSIALYALLGEFAAKPPSPAPSVKLFNLATLIAILMVVAIVVARRFVVGRTEEALSSPSGNGSAVVAWRLGYILTYMLCEAIALLGLVLRFVGFSSSQVAPFYLAGIVLMLFFQPRWPAHEAA